LVNVLWLTRYAGVYGLVYIVKTLECVLNLVRVNALIRVRLHRVH